MQNLSLSIHHSPKTNITTGRKRLSTNIAMIVINGIEKKQICSPPVCPDLGVSPLAAKTSDESAGWDIRTDGIAADASSSLKSGSRTSTGRREQPAGSKNEASRKTCVGG